MAQSEKQQTIAQPATIEGRGLFLGQPASVRFRPAPVNHGVVFVRTDLGNKPVPALVNYVLKRARRTTHSLNVASIAINDMPTRIDSAASIRRTVDALTNLKTVVMSI